MRLYEIEQDYLSLVLQLEEQGGEVTDAQIEQMEITRENWEKKADQYCKVIRTMQSDIAFANAEIARIQRFANIKSNIEERLKNALVEGLKIFGTKDKEKQLWRYQSGTFKLGTRRAEAVEIDELVIEDKWKTVSISNLSIEDSIKVFDTLGKDATELHPSISVLKTSIKDAIQAGEVVDGARIIENFYLNLR